MTTTITKWIVLPILLISTRPRTLIRGQQVPCLFFFGDSLFDNGNNNDLTTTAKANTQPYGIDYRGGVPTGRFTNGLNVADFLAHLLGFNNSIPPFVETRGSAILRGLNYASGGSGILDVSGIQLRGRFSMNKQLLNHLSTIAQSASFLGNLSSTGDHMRKCLYVINIGNNDYINNYYLPKSPSRTLFTPAKFADKLINTFSQQLRTLYDLGTRKVAVFGLGLIGCIPQELSFYPRTNGSQCVDKINNAVALFDSKLVALINQLNSDLPEARYTYLNTTSISQGDPSLVGLKVLNVSCCEVQEKIGQCVPNGRVCINRDEHAFFDNFHPTQISSRATASRSYNASMPTDVFPVDIRTLVHS